MSEATASTNVETASAYSDSGTGSSVEAGESEAPRAANDNARQASNDNTPQASNDNTAVNTLSGGDGAQEGQLEAGMSGPAEVADRPGAGPAANDDTPQVASNYAAQDSSDARTETTGDLAASSTLEAGQGVPAEATLDFGKPLMRDFNSKDAVKKEEDGAKRTGTGGGGGKQQRLKDTFNEAARDKKSTITGTPVGGGEDKAPALEHSAFVRNESTEQNERAEQNDQAEQDRQGEQNRQDEKKKINEQNTKSKGPKL
jgi:hypothetical protein